MTPVAFEAANGAVWTELEKKDAARTDPARYARLYRMACEHLAQAEARAYPVALVERLRAITSDAHQAIYREQDWGLGRLGRLFALDFPAAVRAHRRSMSIAALAFVGPLVAMGLATHADPGLLLTVFDPAEVASFDTMYGDGDEPIGARDAATDVAMFGHYIMNNIGIAFRCFAAGLFFGIGSLLMLAYNGVAIGGVTGYLLWRGHGERFLSFVVTHGAFELTAIVIAGAAGLAIGGALLAPGRRSRVGALTEAAKRAMVLVYGAAAMLLVAAAVEAFWSSARWLPNEVKFAVGGICWVAVLLYLGLQGRPRRAWPGAGGAPPS